MFFHMDIRQLKYFLAITEEGGVTAAAKRLNMSQPPLSSQLKLLEDELGVSLFERKNKRLLLTAEGELLYKQSKILVNDFEHTLELFQDIKKGVSGTLNIGCVCSFAILFFPELTKTFFENNPNLDLHIYENNTGELFKLLENDAIELCIVKGNINHNIYDSIVIDSLVGTEDDCMAALALPHFFSSADDYIHFIELQNKPLIIQRIHEELIKNTCTSYNFSPKLLSTHENVMTAINWSLNDLGISIMPYSATKLISTLTDGDKLVVKKLIDPKISSKTYLIWKRNHNLSPVSTKFIQEMKERLIPH